MNFEAKKKKIWRKYEKVLGRKIPPELREVYEQQLHVQPSFPVTLQDLDGYLKDLFVPVAQFMGECCSGGANDARPHRRYQKSQDRRAHLVEFVDSQREGDHNNDWDRLSRLWSEANPSDPLTSSSLKRSYFRAIRENPSLKSDSRAEVATPLATTNAVPEQAGPVCGVREGALRRVAAQLTEQYTQAWPRYGGILQQERCAWAHLGEETRERLIEQTAQIMEAIGAMRGVPRIEALNLFQCIAAKRRRQMEEGDEGPHSQEG